MKIIKRCLLAAAVIGSVYTQGLCLGSYANDTDAVVSLQINNPVMYVNGCGQELDEGEGTKPVIINGRTLVPIRAIVEAFGGDVYWDGNDRTVTMVMDEDVIRLAIDSTTAYTNNRVDCLEVAPVVINGRTMLPIRYVAEGFNLGVAWEEDERRVTIVRNGFDDEEYQIVTSMVPEYSGKPTAVINENKPFFKGYEIIGSSFEFYADIDELGRCDVTMASIGVDIMPTEERESISSVKPSGWINAAYDFVDGGYLYNRCHLIGFQLTGENANERNLITGTRYLNIDGMLPYENMVADYIEETGNNVMYRSTPVFRENNLVADGVLLEAQSVEDNGDGIRFCVYCYNVQPNVVIDYKTGESYSIIRNEFTENLVEKSEVYRTPTGKRYHFDIKCGGKNTYKVTMDAAIADGLTPCAKCAN